MVVPGHASGTATMYVQAVNWMVVHSTFTIQVRVNTNGSHVNAVQADFTYPTSILSFVSIDSAAMSVFSTETPSTGGGSGSVSVQRSVAGQDGPSGISGDFKVANITFNVVGAGTANINFQNTSKLLDTTSTDVLGTMTDGSFTNQPGMYGGQTLHGGDYILSSNNSYKAIMQSDGNFVVYNSSHKALWSTKTAGHSGAHATLQSDGNFVIYSSSGSALWNAKTNWYPGARAVLQNDGNFVIYNSSGRPLWSWKTGAIYNFMLSGQTMNFGDFMKSTDNRFTANMQTDGNFVVYDSSHNALFNTRTAGNPGDIIKMQSDGNLVVYNTHNVALWNSRTAHNDGAKAILQTDGNLVVYNTSNKALWSWKTGRKY